MVRAALLKEDKLRRYSKLEKNIVAIVIIFILYPSIIDDYGVSFTSTKRVHIAILL